MKPFPQLCFYPFPNNPVGLLDGLCRRFFSATRRTLNPSGLSQKFKITKLLRGFRYTARLFLNALHRSATTCHEHAQNCMLSLEKISDICHHSSDCLRVPPHIVTAADELDPLQFELLRKQVCEHNKVKFIYIRYKQEQ